MKIEFMQKQYHHRGGAALRFTPFFIYFGGLSVRMGRKNIMMLGMFIAAISYFPYCNAMDKTVDLSSKQESIRRNAAWKAR